MSPNKFHKASESLSNQMKSGRLGYSKVEDPVLWEQLIIMIDKKTVSSDSHHTPETSFY